MRYVSVCDGIGAAHLAFQPLGWECVGVSEIDPFCNAVVRHHWNFENLGSLTDENTIEKIRDIAPDVLVGGTPCQSFSVAGERGGIKVGHGQLVLWFLYAVYRARPKYLLWENVYGVLSIDGGAVFRAFVETLDAIGYRLQWRVLDAQYFGVAQTRRRVFLVGYPGGAGTAPREILFESGPGKGNPAKGRKTKQADQRAVAKCLGTRGGLAHREDADPLVVDTLVVDTVTAKWAKGSGGPAGDECQNLVIDRHLGSSGPVKSEIVGTLNTGLTKGGTLQDARAGLLVPEVAPTLMSSVGGPTSGYVPLIAETLTANCRNYAKAGNNAGMVNPIIETKCSGPGRDAIGVRRLTPKECERLMGMPDDHTLVPVKVTKKGRVILMSDSARYRMIGNSIAIPVLQWIGKRIQKVSEKEHEK